MSSPIRRSSGKAARLAAIACLVGCGLAGPAQAQNFFEALFSGLGFRAPRYAPAPMFEPPGFAPQHRALRRPPKVTAVAAPVEKAMVPKTPRAQSMPELLRAILDDDTLRRGDVVVFGDGPRVFVGGGAAPHAMADFQDIRESRLVGNRTRTELLASAGTPEDRLRDQPRQRRRAAAERLPADVATTASTTRVNAIR